jgi:DNA-binding IclR family transcriptional regulator
MNSTIPYNTRRQATGEQREAEILRVLSNRTLPSSEIIRLTGLGETTCKYLLAGMKRNKKVRYDPSRQVYSVPQRTNSFVQS